MHKSQREAVAVKTVVCMSRNMITVSKGLQTNSQNSPVCTHAMSGSHAAIDKVFLIS